MIRMMRLDTAERGAMGERARRRVVEQFSLDVVLDRWEAVYEELLAGDARPGRWGHDAVDSGGGSGLPRENIEQRAR
jgi:hypothetical protein